MKRLICICLFCLGLAACQTTGSGSGQTDEASTAMGGNTRQQALFTYYGCVTGNALEKVGTSSDEAVVSAAVAEAQGMCTSELNSYARKAESYVKKKHSWNRLKTWVTKDYRKNLAAATHKDITAAILVLNTPLEGEEAAQ